MEITPNVKLKNSLAKHQTYFQLIEDIVSKVKHIPQIERLRGDLEIVLLVANCVENELKNNKKLQIDKTSCVKEIIQRIFELTPEELSVLDSQIQMLFDNKLIKKASWYKRGKAMLFAYLKKKD